MFKIFTCFIFTLFLLEVNTLRLYGKKLKSAEKLLNVILEKIIHEDGPIYSQHGLDAAYRFIPNIVYTFDTIVEDFRNREKRCMIALSFAFTDLNVLVTLQCEGDPELTRRIVNEKIFVPDELQSDEYDE